MSLKTTVSVLLLAGMLLLPGKRLTAQPEPDCCFWICSTGRFMGWADALLEYTRPRENPSFLDQIIFDQLTEASRSVERAAQACEPHIPAWPGYRQKQQFLTLQMQELAEVTNHHFKRDRVYHMIDNTYNAWANELSVMKYNDEILNRTTCSTCYFQLGFSTAYAVQALRQAQEALVLNRDEKEAKRQVQQAVSFYYRTLATLNVYDDIQRSTGSFFIRCVDLTTLDLQSRLEALIAATRDLSRLESLITEGNAISDGIQEAMRFGCGVLPQPVNAGNDPNNPSNNAGSPGNSYNHCRSRYCPECDRAVTLLEVSVSEACEECLRKNRLLIEACMEGSLPATPGGQTPGPAQASALNTTPPTNNPSPRQANPLPETIPSASDINTILQNCDCSGFPNTHPVWDPVLKEPYCDCLPGFAWNPDFTACIDLKDRAVAMADCSGFPNSQPVWNEFSQTVTCECLPGFVWNKDNTTCIPEWEAALQGADCSTFPNTQPVWDPNTKEIWCDCLPGYTWNDDFTKCLPRSQNTVQPIDCQNYPNTQPVFDPFSNQYVCDCLPGFVWNNKRTGCVPQRNKPTMNWDNMMNLTMGLLQILNPGNQQGFYPSPGTLPGGGQAPVMHQSNCNDQQQAGGDAPEIHTINLGQSFGSFLFDYEVYQVRDQIIVQQGGTVIFDSGCTSGSKSIPLSLTGFGNQITVRVNPNCDGQTSGTQWNFTVHCPR